jgi:hypothetical protein
MDDGVMQRIRSRRSSDIRGRSRACIEVSFPKAAASDTPTLQLRGIKDAFI